MRGGGPLPYQAVFVLITLMSLLRLLHACFRAFFLFVLVLCTGARCLFLFCSAPMVYPRRLPAWNTYSSVPSCSCKRKNATEKGLSILVAPAFSSCRLNAASDNLLVAGKAERAGAGLTVSRWPVGGVAIITRYAGITVRTHGVVDAVLEENDNKRDFWLVLLFCNTI